MIKYATVLKLAREQIAGKLAQPLLHQSKPGYYFDKQPYGTMKFSKMPIKRHDIVPNWAKLLGLEDWEEAENADMKGPTEAQLKTVRAKQAQANARWVVDPHNWGIAASDQGAVRAVEDFLKNEAGPYNQRFYENKGHRPMDAYPSKFEKKLFKLKEKYKLGPELYDAALEQTDNWTPSESNTMLS